MRRTKKNKRANRKSAVRKNRSSAKSFKTGHSTTAAGKSRAEGIRLFMVAGRPSKEDFVRVYGPAGPKMTWEQRAKAGVPAEKFQGALAAAMRQAKERACRISLFQSPPWSRRLTDPSTIEPFPRREMWDFC